MVKIIVCSRSVALIIIDPLSVVINTLLRIGMVDRVGVILDNFCRDTCMSVLVVENFIVDTVTKFKEVYVMDKL
tara:strand:- start:14262 stop:14483 length:222 start_codon:yes stop_codon:yes gene_type:complete